jgi:PelA/Pel-15E family pectate lyase
VRSPGTPAAGLALLEGWRRTGREPYLAAARRAGDFLIATQLAHGGWFSELPADGDATPWWFRWTADTRAMLDDDVTPGAVRLLLALWGATGDARYRAAAEHGIELMAEAQLPSGAWPLDARPTWLRTVHPHYDDQPALNDGATPFAITTMIAASAALDRPDLLARARRAGDWLVSAQGAEPRAGWAQQYTAAGAPAGARAFEVPALATWETRHAIEALLALAEETAEPSYCESALRAARWLDAIRVGPACWARFVDPADGRAIFVDESGARVATSRQARPGYSWMGEFGIPWVLRRTGVEQNNAPYRVPGDPGRCLEDPAPPRPLAGPRALAAEAGSRFVDVFATSTCRVD